MTDPQNDVADIAWMRQLAEEGGRTPMRGAVILLAAGVMFGTASLIHWAVASRLIVLSTTLFSFLWLITTGLFLIVVGVVNTRLGRSGGVITTANRAVGAVWAGVGYGIFALFGSLAIIGWQVGNSVGPVVFSLIPCAIMVFYGMGWAVTSAMHRSRPLFILALASFVAGPVLALLTGQADQYLAYGIALYLLMALPGWLLMRQARG